MGMYGNSHLTEREYCEREARLYQLLSQMEHEWKEQAMRNGANVSRQSITLRMDRSRENSAKAMHYLTRAQTLKEQGK